MYFKKEEKRIERKLYRMAIFNKVKADNSEVNETVTEEVNSVEE